MELPASEFTYVYVCASGLAWARRPDPPVIIRSSRSLGPVAWREATLSVSAARHLQQ
jgi:hypothetical protein